MAESEESVRQRLLAKRIGLQFHDSAVFVPAGHHGSFRIAPMECGGYWIDEKVDDIAWWAVASRLNELSPMRIIDHAWFAAKDDRLTEHWALVTEPYMDEAHARSVLDAAEKLHRNGC